MVVKELLCLIVSIHFTPYTNVVECQAEEQVAGLQMAVDSE